MAAETVALVIGLGSISLVAVRLAASSLAIASNEIGYRRQRRRTLGRFSKLMAGSGTKRALVPLDSNGAAWHGRRKFRIVRRAYETVDQSVCSFYLAPIDRRPLPSYRPGQFLTFEFADPAGGRKQSRCYSLSDAPVKDGSQGEYRITVKRLAPPSKAGPGIPGGQISNHFHELAENTVLDVFAPSGRFVLDQAAKRPVVLIAGGVGITPLASMLNWIVANQPKRQVWLFFGVRNRGDHIMYDHLKQLRETCPNVRVITFYSRPSRHCRVGIDYDAEGHVTVGAISQILQGGDFAFYVCGPDAMMRQILHDLGRWGVPEKDVAFEAFSSPRRSAEPGQDGAGIGEADAGATPINVEFSRSRKRVRWSPGAGSLLELAEANGINMRYGCRSGGCGTCETAVLGGDVAYSQQPVVEPKPGMCLACIARPTRDIVLDA